MHTLSSAKSLLKLSKLTKILLHVYVYHLPPPPEANPSESVLRAASQLWSGMTRIIFVKFNKKALKRQQQSNHTFSRLMVMMVLRENSS